eukprot:GHVU01173983.1.p1 GENE.GHVU01173983.1~~GHVU01173983.1.p1  ORF type:complete len:387 (+),score=14.79 GHVU01173983.1:193-1353(+)
MVDGFSKFCRLGISMSCTAEAASQHLTDWCRSYNVPLWLVSDQGSHFKAKIINALTQQLGYKHHLVPVAVPWADGIAENMGKQVLKTLRVLHSEVRVAGKEYTWTDCLALVEKRLNETHYRKLNHVPKQAFLNPTLGRPRSQQEEIAQQGKEAMLQRPLVSDALLELHREWEVCCERQTGANDAMRLREDERRRNTLHKHLPCFLPGDYVLLARTTREEGEKCYGRWFGPFRILDVYERSNWSYLVQDLCTTPPRTHVAHIRRLKFFCRGDEATLLDMTKLAKLAGAREYEIEHISDFVFKENHRDSTIRVKYLGFEKKETALVRIFCRGAPELYVRVLAETQTEVPVPFLLWLHTFLRCCESAGRRSQRFLERAYPTIFQGEIQQ